MKIYLLTDFGSTYTKVMAVDVQAGKIAAFAKAFTTIDTDVAIGYQAAKKEIAAQLGSAVYEKCLAASSAAGGLKMVSSGLVPDLTAKASRLAAASAGAKVVKTYAYELTEAESEEIYAIEPDIMLLSGGIDGGNKRVLLHNAGIIAAIPRNFSVIIAGNRSAAAEARAILERAGKNTVVTPNVMPVFGKLNIMPAKGAIRDLFIANIITAKGLDNVQATMDMEIIPTPLAVLEACELLSRGTTTQDGLGELMAYDLGGATTDVYSMADGSPKTPNAFIHGITEPFDKRTVEGDVGMRYSQAALYDLILEDNPAVFYDEYAITPEEVDAWLAICRDDPGVLPLGQYEQYNNVDSALAAEAIRISAARHAGYNERVFTPAGEAFSQTGKDLTQVSHIIGTGGAIINAKNPAAVLRHAAYSPRDLGALKPLAPKMLLDTQNSFAAMGLLARFHPDTALGIMKDNFAKI
ncbi:MAG: methylaspartate mutase accessory protein GlmL [Defluviitaleaceae bacterium]|nr:methylaspartate mutase accessory protein GlmL [Defluviitaleaceae bacterium]